MKIRHLILTAVTTSFALPTVASADVPIWVGDPTNGEKLFKKECAACHGNDGAGGRVGVSLRNAGRMNSILNDHMVAIIKTGKGLKRANEHKFGKKLGYLDTWDVIAHVRSLHLGLDDFFPDASRYLSGKYTIDKFGLERIKEALGKDLDEKEAYVFTFFDFAGEEGNLRFVPNNPILLDQLKKKFKSGYLVFLPFNASGFTGEIGIGMDKTGKITRVAIHESAQQSGKLNKTLSRFEGHGKKGQKVPFKVGGSKDIKKVSPKVFAAYLRAMETVTMYDRDERERTWADEE